MGGEFAILQCEDDSMLKNGFMRRPSTRRELHWQMQECIENLELKGKSFVEKVALLC